MLLLIAKHRNLNRIYEKYIVEQFIYIFYMSVYMYNISGIIPELRVLVLFIFNLLQLHETLNFSSFFIDKVLTKLKHHLS